MWVCILINALKITTNCQREGLGGSGFCYLIMSYCNNTCTSHDMSSWWDPVNQLKRLLSNHDQVTENITSWLLMYVVIHLVTMATYGFGHDGMVGVRVSQVMYRD